MTARRTIGNASRVVAMSFTLGGLAACGGSTLPLVGDGGSDGSTSDGRVLDATPDAPRSLAGRYTGTATTNTTPISPPGSPQSSMTMLVIDVADGPGANQLTLTLSPSASPCSLTLNRAGETASVPANARCNLSAGDGGVVGSLVASEGSAIFSGNSLSFRLVATLMASVNGVSTTSTAVVIFSGTRP